MSIINYYCTNQRRDYVLKLNNIRLYIFFFSWYAYKDRFRLFSLMKGEWKTELRFIRDILGYRLGLFEMICIMSVSDVASSLKEIPTIFHSLRIQRETFPYDYNHLYFLS